MKFVKPILLVAATVFVHFVEGATCGQLAGVKGKTVEVLRVQTGREGETVRYAMRMDEGKVAPLECDDIVLTGRDASVKLILASGKLSLGPESRIEVAAHSGSGGGNVSNKVNLINLTYGKMRSLIQKAPVSPKGAGKVKEGDVSFRVRTFSAVTGVRGTDFFTSYDHNTGLTEQATLEGSIEVRQTGSSQVVVVEAGHQVSVATTPNAVAEAKERLKSGTSDPSQEPPKQLPDSSAKIAPLKVVPIRESLRNEIRVASVAVQDEKDFSHHKAVEIIGKPETWTFEREKTPDKLNKLKNEF